MSAAHIFYLPIFVFVGALAGYFIGRRAAEEEMRRSARRRARRAPADDRPSQ